jgi:hypothetical protein
MKNADRAENSQNITDGKTGRGNLEDPGTDGSIILQWISF